MSHLQREPLRVAGWIFWIAFFIWKIFLQPTGLPQRLPAEVHVSIDLAASMLLLVASLSLVRGEHPAVAFFASPLEARWMSGSHVRDWISIPYLQIRNIFDRLPSFMIFLVFVLSYCLPAVHSLSVFVLGVLNVVVLTLCSRLCSLPRELAPLWLRIPLIGIGIVAGIYALIAGLEAFAHLLSIDPPVLRLLPPLHPGQAFILGAQGDVRVTCAVLAAATACIVSLVFLSRDRYPALFEISRAGWEVRQRFRDGRTHQNEHVHGDDTSAAALAKIPAGARVLLWTNWQVYRRQNWSYWPMLRPLSALGIGAAVALLHIAPDTLLNTIGTVFALTTTFSSLIDAVRIGITIRHPIFWLTQEKFSARLTMLLFSSYWRSALDIVLFGLGTILGGAGARDVCTAIVVLVVGIWLQRCIGLAAFALLPSKADMAGPTALARFALAISLTIPPVVSALVIQFFTRSATAGYACGCAIALIEALILIHVSSSLLDGKFDKILA